MMLIHISIRKKDRVPGPLSSLFDRLACYVVEFYFETTILIMSRSYRQIWRIIHFDRLGPSWTRDFVAIVTLCPVVQN